MSLGGLFWNLHQEHRINTAQSAAARGQNKADSATREVDRLNDRVERLQLVCMAMWSLLREVAKFSEEDLLREVERIDLMDGQVDGKATRARRECSQCGRVMSARHYKCLYCGAEPQDRTAFDGI